MLTPAASRRLHSTTTVSTVAELTAAVANASISRILLVAGTYAFSSGTACRAGDDPSALCISRDVSLEALEPSSVVLDAQGSSSSLRRLLYIGAGTVGLIGLNITGGHASNVSDLALSALNPYPSSPPMSPSFAAAAFSPAVPAFLNLLDTFLERPRSRKVPVNDHVMIESHVMESRLMTWQRVRACLYEPSWYFHRTPPIEETCLN